MIDKVYESTDNVNKVRAEIGYCELPKHIRTRRYDLLHLY